ncbi:MAG: hypothetical protein KC646_01295 [Candidatus Cloacimonetes bacterium]|nr:hypothetical protein [Candidatus Cloacimonadota bacterium]
MNTLKQETVTPTLIQPQKVSKKTILTLSKENKNEAISKRYKQDQIQNQKIRALTEQVGGLMKTLSAYKEIEKQSNQQEKVINSQSKQISDLEMKIIEFSKEMYSHKLENDQKITLIQSQVKENTYKSSFSGLVETIKHFLFGY